MPENTKTIAFACTAEDIILFRTANPKVETNNIKIMKLQPMNQARHRDNCDRVGEIWILLSGVSYPMRAESIEEKGDEISFLRFVDGKDGKRTEKITAQKQHVIYLAETIAAD